MGRGFGIEAAVPHDVAAKVAAEAEALGYTSFWVNNPPRSDGLASLAAAAAATTRINLGVGVIPLDSHPAHEIAANAQRHALPLGRLLLGVGSGGDQRGLVRVRDGVGQLRAQLDTRVIISALGPRMTELAGEIADGVLFNWCSPEFEEDAAARMCAASTAVVVPGR